MWSGCGTALVTPFRADLSLDEAAMHRLVRRQVDAGINFLAPCGTTGENPTLSRDETLRVVEITIEEAQGRVPVLAGPVVISRTHPPGLTRRPLNLGRCQIIEVFMPEVVTDLAGCW